MKILEFSAAPLAALPPAACAAALAAQAAGLLPDDEHNHEEVLGRHEFIGLTERIQESLDYLADQLGKPRILVPRVNAHEGESAPIPADVARRFRARNGLDYKVYHHAVDTFLPVMLPYHMTLDGIADSP